MRYHLQVPKGWINDPNGLSFYKGEIHAFYQHNPFSTKWDVMHWGHATSTDFISWEDKGIALYPTEEYENTWGCFSGSGIVVEDKHYLFYTAVSKKFGQSQCLAIGDGKTYKKYSKNPIITSPLSSNENFRDPKVFFFNDKYYMVCGGEEKGEGVILLYSSQNLLDWDYLGIIYSSSDFGGTLECPDFFPIRNKWVLTFSAMKPCKEKQVFVIGEFNGVSFNAEKVCYPILGKDFYAGQTLNYIKDRVLIGWLYHHGRELKKEENKAGAFSIPCKVDLIDDNLIIYPVDQAKKLLKNSCELVTIENDVLTIKTQDKIITSYSLKDKNVSKIEYLQDEEILEIFINGGQYYIAQWLI